MDNSQKGKRRAGDQRWGAQAELEGNVDGHDGRPEIRSGQSELPGSQSSRPALAVQTPLFQPAVAGPSGSSSRAMSFDEEIAELLATSEGQDVPPYPSHLPTIPGQTQNDLKKRLPATPNSPKDTNGRFELSLQLSHRVPLKSPWWKRREVAEIGIDRTGRPFPKLRIVIFIVGSRGDVQPYIALALGLIRTHGHRVRLATHGEFRNFVLDSNSLLEGEVDDQGMPLEGRLEFFDAGGDPRELMAYMVKNPGIIPGVGSIINGDIGAKKRMTATYIRGFYNSTFFPDGRNGPFAADAIISNPPAFAHVHVAEALGIPLHMSFSTSLPPPKLIVAMPWSPTLAFPHPLVTIKDSNGEPGVANHVSYHMAENLMWQGLGGLINKFRTSFLGLDGLDWKVAPQASNRSMIPWTYCWSQALIPKPIDWRSNVDVSGFYFLEGKSGYEPDPALLDFMSAGPAPMYIGFGSVPVADPADMTSALSTVVATGLTAETIFEAVQKAGVRALVSAGWGGLGGIECPPEIHILQGSIPHDWLFADGKVSAVCHHGGAGTTAIGLANGLPTIVVPFFGDQQFWGDMIRNAGAGPPPIPPKHLTADTLARAIHFVYSPTAQTAAREMGRTIRSEDGVRSGVESFNKHLPLLHMRCDIDPSKVALWWHRKLCLRLSGAAAVVLSEAGFVGMDELALHRSKEYDFAKHETEVTQGAVQGVVNVVSTTFAGFAELLYAPHRGLFKLTWGLSAGTFDIIHDIYQGMDNIPGMIGSDTRVRRKVTGWKTGLREAGLVFGYGLWDGLTGLVTEPYVAVKQEGAIGLLTGTGRGLVNAVMRPSAGTVGLLTLPWKGFAMSVRRSLRRRPEVVFRQPRLDISYSAAESLTKEERTQIVERFNTLTRSKETRRRMYQHHKLRHRPFLIGEMVSSRANTPTASRATSRTTSPELNGAELSTEGTPPPVPSKDR